MQERDLGSIQPGLEVCDVDGDTFGTVSHIHRAAPESVADDILEVKSGFLGLGKHYYIPASAIEEVTRAAVVLTARRSDFESLGWEARPEHLSAIS